VNVELDMKIQKYGVVSDVENRQTLFVEKFNYYTLSKLTK
jgi:hypothetical protein